VQHRTRGSRSAAALELKVRQMGRNSVRPVPQEPPILVVTKVLLCPLRSPPPAVVRPLLPPHGAESRPFIGEEHPPGSPDGHTRHTRQPATADECRAECGSSRLRGSRRRCRCACCGANRPRRCSGVVRRKWGGKIWRHHPHVVCGRLRAVGHPPHRATGAARKQLARPPRVRLLQCKRGWCRRNPLCCPQP